MSVIWAFFNQGDVNHITGDINFISLFLSKKKTINTILDHDSLNRLKGIKWLVYYIFWVIILLKSSYLISISHKTKKEILKYTNIDKNKIIVSGICIQSIYKKNKKNLIKKTKNIGYRD